MIARLHTVAEDTLGELRTQVASWDHPPLEWAAETCMATDPDPDDLIFPRTTTRLGSKYQAVIPAKDNPRDPGWWRGALPFLVLLTRHLQIFKNVVGRPL